jgi:hypothetical protein
MSTPREHVKINSAMRDAFRASRITVHDDGRILRAPAAEEPEEQTEAAEPERLGRADAGARGAVPEDPVASINNAIRTSARRRGT